MLLECIYLGVGTAVKAQLLDDLLHSFPSLFPGHVGRQAKGSRKVQVFTHCQCSHHNIILNVSRTNDNYASEKIHHNYCIDVPYFEGKTIAHWPWASIYIPRI